MFARSLATLRYIALGHLAPVWGVVSLGCAPAAELEVLDAEACELDLHEHDEAAHTTVDPGLAWSLSGASDGLIEQATDIDIVDWPIGFDEERMALTVEYLRFHAADRQLTGDLETDVTMVPRVVVLHWTAGPTARSAWWAFQPARHGSATDPERALNVSTQFIVDRDGTIYRLFREDLIGRHTIGLNHLAIGVENVGGGRRWPLTQAQVEANSALVRYLSAKYPITHVIGHHEYRDLEGHAYFRETDPGFRTFKCDPGPRFMEGVRADIAELGLLGATAPDATRACRW